MLNINYKILKNNKKNPQILKQGGFTLLETLIALLLLVMVLNPAFTLLSNSLLGSKYAKNQMTADYLLQEVVDFIRNDRDSFTQNNKDWDGFVKKYGLVDGGIGKTIKSSCVIETSPLNNVVDCQTIPDNSESSIPPTTLYYDKSSVYGGYYTTKSNIANATPTIFKREVLMTLLEGDEVDISVTVTWSDGFSEKKRTLYSSLLNWQQ